MFLYYAIYFLGCACLLLIGLYLLCFIIALLIDLCMHVSTKIMMRKFEKIVKGKK